MPTQTSQTMADHFKASIVLGIPLIGAQLAQMSINVVDTIMLGWLGIEELAGGTLAFQIFFILMIIGMGIAVALMPIISGALGRGEERDVRRAARMGLWAMGLMALSFMIPLWFTEQILISLGQQADLAEIAGRYMRIAQWSMIPALLIVALRTFLASLEKAQIVFWITVFMSVLNGVLNYALIFGNLGAPKLGVEGAAWATLFANLTALAVIAAYVFFSKATRHYQIFSRLWVSDWETFGKIFKLGIPISLTILAEVSLFSAAAILIGWLGTIPLAAHGIVLQIASLAFMVPLGLSNVATIRVGNAVGRKDNVAVGAASHVILWLAFGFSILSALVMVLIPEALIRLFLDQNNPQLNQVLTYAAPLLFMAALFQVGDALQAVAGGALRGLSDTKIPLLFAVISYWPVGLAAAYILAFPLGYGGAGVWAGLAIGLAVAAVLLLSRFLRREKLGLLPQ